MVFPKRGRKMAPLPARPTPTSSGILKTFSLPNKGLDQEAKEGVSQKKKTPIVRIEVLGELAIASPKAGAANAMQGISKRECHN